MSFVWLSQQRQSSEDKGSTEFIRGMSPVSLLTSEGIDVASFTPALSLCLEMLLYLTYGHAVSIAVLLVVLH